jgi:hypothetical protein
MRTTHVPSVGRSVWTDEDHLMDETSHDEISGIEMRLDELGDIAERCRKIILASKLAIAGGAGLLLVIVLGLLGSGPVVALGAIAAVLGGIVSLGSNVSTLQQTTAAMAGAEARRAELIDGIALRLVGDGHERELAQPSSAR